MGDKEPLVSLIIPTCNSTKTLDICLESIKTQTYPNTEIIVVDKYSEDQTIEIAKKFGGIVVKSDAARSRARNIGAEEAKGRYLLFIDSDMCLTNTVVEDCVKNISEGYDALVIPEISIGTGFWAQCRSLEKLCYIGDETIEAARFFKSEVFECVLGFDRKLVVGEDWDLHQRVNGAGFKIWRINSYIEHHEGKLSLRNVIMKKYLYGKTLNMFIKKHCVTHHFNPFRMAFVKNWRALARDPIHALGMLFMKTCEFGLGGLGFLRNFMITITEKEDS